MEIPEKIVRFPAAPIAFVLVALSVLALALTAMYTLRGVTSPQNQGADRPVVTACSGLGPDAQDRCEHITATQQSRAEATHGH